MKNLCILLLVCAFNASALELTVVGGSGQTAVVGTPFQERFSVRLTTDDGDPIADALISFGNNGCVLMLGTTCPPPSAWGLFESGERYAIAYTNSDGVAVSPTYIAGSTPSQGNSIFAYPPSEQPPHFFTPRQSLGAIQSIGFGQTLPTAVPIPMLSSFSSLLLVALMVFVAYKRLWLARKYCRPLD